MWTLEIKITSQTKNQVSKVKLHVEKCWHPIIHIQKDDTFYQKKKKDDT